MPIRAGSTIYSFLVTDSNTQTYKGNGTGIGNGYNFPYTIDIPSQIQDNLMGGDVPLYARLYYVAY